MGPQFLEILPAILMFTNCFFRGKIDSQSHIHPSIPLSTHRPGHRTCSIPAFGNATPLRHATRLGTARGVAARRAAEATKLVERVTWGTCAIHGDTLAV